MIELRMIEDILAKLDLISERIETSDARLILAVQIGERIMTTLTDLQPAMATLTADVTSNATDSASAIADIKALVAQIAAGITGGASDADLVALTAQVTTNITALEASNAALVA